MEEIDGVALDGFWTDAGFAEEGEDLLGAAKLCLPLVGVFFTLSVTAARKRAAAPVGETAFARAGAFAVVADEVEGLADVEDDRDGLVVGAGGATGAFGAKEARLLALGPNNEDDMLLAIFGTMAGFKDEAEDELAAFLIGDADADEEGSRPFDAVPALD
jgi:hypothetical protein